MKNSKSISFLTKSAVIAALYVVLTWLSSTLGLASGVVQLRLSEALTILPLFTPAAIPGLFIGCLLANIMTGSVVWDVVFGSLATLIGAFGTYLLRKKSIYLAPLPPILANAVIVPFVLQYAYMAEGSYWFFMLTVGAGEVLSCGVLGVLLAKALRRSKISL